MKHQTPPLPRSHAPPTRGAGAPNASSAAPRPRLPYPCSHAPRGNTSSAAPRPRNDRVPRPIGRRIGRGRGASAEPFPRRAWERGEHRTPPFPRSHALPTRGAGAPNASSAAPRPRLPLLVPTLRRPAARVPRTHLRPLRGPVTTQGNLGQERGASEEPFPRRAWERGDLKHQNNACFSSSP